MFLLVWRKVELPQNLSSLMMDGNQLVWILLVLRPNLKIVPSKQLNLKASRPVLKIMHTVLMLLLTSVSQFCESIN